MCHNSEVVVHPTSVYQSLYVNGLVSLTGRKSPRETAKNSPSMANQKRAETLLQQRPALIKPHGGAR